MQAHSYFDIFNERKEIRIVNLCDKIVKPRVLILQRYFQGSDKNNECDLPPNLCHDRIFWGDKNIFILFISFCSKLILLHGLSSFKLFSFQSGSSIVIFLFLFST